MGRNNPEVLKRYAESHKEQIRETGRKYRETHKEKLREWQRKARAANPEKYREQAKKTYRKYKDKKREYQNALRKKYKDTFLGMYGNSCACCGETIYEFLTIEHKNGQEKITRRTGLVAYRDAIKEYRPDLYEVLCWNCNCAKGKLGYCPHHPPETIQPYKIHRSDKPYKYTKPIDSLGRRYEQTQ